MKLSKAGPVTSSAVFFETRFVGNSINSVFSTRLPINRQIGHFSLQEVTDTNINLKTDFFRKRCPDANPDRPIRLDRLTLSIKTRLNSSTRMIFRLRASRR